VDQSILPAGRRDFVCLSDIGSWDEMVKAMTAHVLKEHPQTANDMQRMHEQDPRKWGREMRPKWDSKPEA
jgi:hypothetical protein